MNCGDLNPKTNKKKKSLATPGQAATLPQSPPFPYSSPGKMNPSSFSHGIFRPYSLNSDAQLSLANPYHKRKSVNKTITKRPNKGQTGN